MSNPSTDSVPVPDASQRWVERLQRFAEGNQTVTAFCAVEGVSVASYYSWKRRLAPPSDAPATRVLKVVPLRITPSATGSVELTLPSGAMVRFPADISPELVVAILRGWEGPAC